MKKYFWLLLILTASPGLLFGGSPMAKRMISKGDKQHDKRESAKAVSKSESYYQKALAIEPSSSEAMWKLARLYYWKGEHTDGDDAKMEIFKKGIRYAQEAVKLKGDCMECRFWLAVSYGSYGTAKGVMASLDLVPHVKKELKILLAKKPAFEYGGPHRVMGRLYHKLPGFKGGDNTKAIEHYRKAIELGPQNIMNHRFLAEVLIDEGQKAEAEQLLRKVESTPEADIPAAILPNMREEKKQATTLLKKHFN